MKNALIVPIGKSPQIVTEALYLLIQHHNTIDHVCLIGTYESFQQWRECQPIVAQLCQTLNIAPSWQYINVLDLPNDDALKAQTGNAFFKTIELLQRQYNALYLCINGGHKAMNFQIVHIFTLIARNHDGIFHIVIHQHPLPSDFFYPLNREQQIWIQLKWIAFVPAGRFIPDNQVNQYADLLQNLSLSLEKSQLSVIFHDQKRQISINDSIVIQLPASSYVLYRWASEKAQNDRPEIILDSPWQHSYLACYAKIYMTGAYYERIRHRLIESPDSRLFFHENKSRINRALTKKLGNKMAGEIGIQKQVKNHRTIYQVGLKKTQIQLANEI